MEGKDHSKSLVSGNKFGGINSPAGESSIPQSSVLFYGITIKSDLPPFLPSFVPSFSQ